MTDLSNFSSLFPSLSSFFGQPGVNARPPRPESDGRDGGRTDDRVELSEPAKQPIPSGLRTSTFDTPGTGESIAVADDGTYEPAVRSAQIGVATHFSFSMSFQRELSATVSQPEVTRQPSGSEARLQALESRSLYYQSMMNASRGRVAGGYAESRSVQTEMFFSRTRELSMRLPASEAERFDETSARVARSFELSIQLDFSFLGQFTEQSASIASLDDDLFGRYLDNTNGLSERSSEALQGFFDDVDRILGESASFVSDSLGAFFDQVSEQFGLDEQEAVALEEMVRTEVDAFFREVDAFLSEARQTLGMPNEPTDIAEPAPDPEAADKESPVLAA